MIKKLGQAPWDDRGHIRAVRSRTLPASGANSDALLNACSEVGSLWDRGFISSRLLPVPEPQLWPPRCQSPRGALIPIRRQSQHPV